jgi:DNA-binding response OmpR family regulator
METAARRTDHPPIIAVTAHVTADGGPSMLASGFDDVIYKPVNAPELLGKIGKCLGAQYEYRGPDALGGEDADRSPIVLTPDDLSVVPQEWLREFSRALRRGRSVQMLALIDRLPPERADVGRVLAELVRADAFDTLIAVTEGVYKDRSHG